MADRTRSELRVGDRFNTCHELDAAVLHWAFQHHTKLGLHPELDRSGGHLVRRWTCQSWTHPDLPCKHRDCVLEIEATYSSQYGW